MFATEPESTMAVEAVTAESIEVVDLAGAEAQEPERLGSGMDEPQAPAWNAAGDADQAWSPEPAGGWGSDDDFGSVGASSNDDYSAGDSLDDDAFFASLRDAVRDDEPLGPRDDDYYDDDAEGGKKLFRRRR